MANGDGINRLQNGVGKVSSRVGAAFIGSHAVFRGKDLHADLGDATWIDLYLFGVTGRRFPAPVLRLLEAVWTYSSYPDARIWNNRVAALAGTARSTGNLGVAAALAVSEAEIYGQGPGYRAIEFIVRLRRATLAGDDVGSYVELEIKKNRRVWGYGRPINGDTDERIAPLLRLAEQLGLSGGPHLRLAFEVEEHLVRTRGLRINYGAVIAGLSADVGLTPSEHYWLLFPIFLAGMVPCYIDSSQQPEGTLLPLPCDAVLYTGPPKRSWSG